MSDTRRAYQFGAFQVEPEERRLSRGGETVALPPKAFDLLVMLVEEPGRLLRKGDLIERLWPGVFVEEVNLAQNISTIRRALGGDGRETYIQTVAGTGYRFVAPVRTARVSSDTDRPRSRVVVLPFRMLKPDEDLGFLAFSLPDALTTALSGLDSVVVRSSLMAARFGGETIHLPTIAREANVDLVVSGTILRVGDRLRVAAQLADAASGALVWSHTEQSPVDDLFRVQDALVERIVASLSRPLSERDARQIRRDVPASPKAYEYYLRANEASRANTMDASSWTVARDLYLQSIAEDARYAPTWTRLARVYRLLSKYRPEECSDTVALAEEALQRALTINPDLSMAQNLYAHIEIDRGRAADAMVRLLERAGGGRADAEIFAGLVQACRFCGLLDASVAAHRQAQKCDPMMTTSVQHTYFVMQRYEDSMAAPGALRGYVFTLCLHAVGRTARALELVSSLEKSAHRLPSEMIAAARAYVEGRRDDSLAALEIMASKPTDPENSFYTARQFAAVGAVRQSLATLTRSIDGGYFSPEPLERDPAFDGMRTGREFQALLQRARGGRDAALAAFQRAGGPRILSL